MSHLLACIPEEKARILQGMTFPTRYLSIAINRPAKDVYAYASNPANLPQWASGLSSTIKQEGDEWVADSPMGPIRIKFAPQNSFGVIDHDVTVGKDVFSNPMRVIPNDNGCDVVFTLFRRPEMTDEAFEEDAKTIEKDLLKLKRILQNEV